MHTTAPAPQGQPLNLLADWISREQLAGELGLASDTLARWDVFRRAKLTPMAG